MSAGVPTNPFRPDRPGEIDPFRRSQTQATSWRRPQGPTSGQAPSGSPANTAYVDTGEDWEHLFSEAKHTTDHGTSVAELVQGSASVAEPGQLIVCSSSTAAAATKPVRKSRSTRTHVPCTATATTLRVLVVLHKRGGPIPVREIVVHAGVGKTSVVDAIAIAKAEEWLVVDHGIDSWSEDDAKANQYKVTAK